jgi:hypothetical protein
VVSDVTPVSPSVKASASRAFLARGLAYVDVAIVPGANAWIASGGGAGALRAIASSVGIKIEIVGLEVGDATRLLRLCADFRHRVGELISETVGASSAVGASDWWRRQGDVPLSGGVSQHRAGSVVVIMPRTARIAVRRNLGGGDEVIDAVPEAACRSRSSCSRFRLKRGDPVRALLHERETVRAVSRYDAVLLSHCRRRHSSLQQVQETSCAVTS